MGKTSHAIRRSGVRLISMGSSHRDLQMVISQLKNVKNTFKAFSKAQHEAHHDLVTWSSTMENRAIKDSLMRMAELTSIWCDEVCEAFADQIKVFRQEFEAILDAEKALDQAKLNVEEVRGKEQKISKELRKMDPRDLSNTRDQEAKLRGATEQRLLAERNLEDQTEEVEVTKMIRVKKGILKYAEAHKTFGNKCDLIFSAAHRVASQIPDVEGESIKNIRYTGGSVTYEIVRALKEQFGFPEQSTARRRRNHRRGSSGVIIQEPPTSPSNTSVNGRTLSPGTQPDLNDEDPPPYWSLQPQPESNPFFDINPLGNEGDISPNAPQEPNIQAQMSMSSHNLRHRQRRHHSQLSIDRLHEIERRDEATGNQARMIPFLKRLSLGNRR